MLSSHNPDIFRITSMFFFLSLESENSFSTPVFTCPSKLYAGILSVEYFCKIVCSIFFMLFIVSVFLSTL